MNNTTAVFLINDKVRAILATYEAGDNAPKEYFKTFDASIKIGDLVNVTSETRHCFTVVKVTDVDVEFDIGTGTKFKWITGKIDLADYQNTLAMEDSALKAIASAEKTKRREELRKALFADQEAKISALPIAHFAGASPVLENKG